MVDPVGGSLADDDELLVELRAAAVALVVGLVVHRRHRSDGACGYDADERRFMDLPESGGQGLQPVGMWLHGTSNILNANANDSYWRYQYSNGSTTSTR